MSIVTRFCIIVFCLSLVVIYDVMAVNVATLTVYVVGVRAQGLKFAKVDIYDSASNKIFSGVADEQGVVSIEVPYDTYTIITDYKGWKNTATANVNSPYGTRIVIETNIFIDFEPLGPMTMNTFILWIIVIAIVIIVIAIVNREYHVWRRKRLPKLYGAPRVPGA